MRSVELCLDGAVDVSVDVVGADQVDCSVIEKGKQLLDSGAITQTEFDALKAKALA